MIFVYVTFPSKKEAKKISQEILKKRIVGCINIFPIESTYWWKRKLANKKEVVVIFKTLKKNFKKLEKAIKKLSPFNIPCIAPIEVSKINKEYKDWIKSEVL